MFCSLYDLLDLTLCAGSTAGSRIKPFILIGERACLKEKVYSQESESLYY
jgi:hypothetical protein